MPISFQSLIADDFNWHRTGAAQSWPRRDKNIVSNTSVQKNFCIFMTFFDFMNQCLFTSFEDKSRSWAIPMKETGRLDNLRTSLNVCKIKNLTENTCYTIQLPFYLFTIIGLIDTNNDPVWFTWLWFRTELSTFLKNLPVILRFEFNRRMISRLYGFLKVFYEKSTLQNP